MLSRAERTSQITAAGCTNESVGPGSYAVLESPKQPSGPSAAFAWAGKRSAALPASPPPATAATSLAAAADETSSPSAAAVIRPWADNTSSSCFASSTQRFAVDKEAVAKPGPGAYSTSPHWTKQQPCQWHPAGSSSSRDGPQHKHSAELIGCGVRAPAGQSAAAATAAAAGGGKSCSTMQGELLLSTPPSIPARHQSFGYEPGPDGGLIMQPPPPPPIPEPTAASHKPAAAENTAQSKVGANGSRSRNSSSRPKSPARPSTSQLSRSLQQATAVAGGSGSMGSSSSSRGCVSPGQGPAALQLQQQRLQGAQEPAAYHHSQQPQQQLGSPRFRCAAGGKLILSKSCGRAGSAAFASKSARFHQQEPDPNKLTPGPGAYTNTSSSSYCSGSGSTTAARPSSAPVHAAALAHPCAAAFMSPRQPRYQQQLFARSAGRSAVLSAGPGWSLPPSKSVGPGPAAYQVSTSLQTTADRAHSNVARAYGRTGQSTVASSRPHTSLTAAALGVETGMAAAAAGTSEGFGCSSRRFGDDSTVSPGPGKYTADQLMSMAADAARRAAAAGRRGAFGSAASRKPRSSSMIDDCLGLSSGGGGGQSGVPGPGCYDAGAGLADRVAVAAARPSAGFASASERFTQQAAAAPIAAPDYSSPSDGTTTTIMRGDQSRLGPGAYLQMDDWRRGADNSSSSARHSGYHQAPFGSESCRHAGVSAAGGMGAPGPGAYAAVDVSKVFQPLSMPGMAGFCTTSQRFKLKAATPEAVGPGTYTQHSSLLRPTFNVTLDQ